jgi:hypothetical protein
VGKAHEGNTAQEATTVPWQGQLLCHVSPRYPATHPDDIPF